MMERSQDKKEIIRIIYLYLFSLVGLVLVVIGCVRLVDLGLKVWLFKKADQIVIYPAYPKIPRSPTGEKETILTPEEEKRYREEQAEFEKKNKETERSRTAANSLAMIIVGGPLFLYHWRIIQKSRNSI